MRAHRALRLRVLVLVVLLHAAGLWLLLNGRGDDAAPAAVARIAVRLLPLPPSAAPPAPRSEPAATAHERTARPRPAAARLRDPATLPAAPQAPAAIGIAPLPAEAPASQALAEPPPSLMDGEATRRAIRAAAREPGLAAQAGRQGPALRTPDERLGDEVQRSAKGDCLKGEYLGGGMGLLSLPFLAAAALRDQCRR
ncbi:MAG: hypothetical protein JSR75_22920 [Proteobacteria bacterium]|nr:hypothetical protein [Pseudomonadota bacterium]